MSLDHRHVPCRHIRTTDRPVHSGLAALCEAIAFFGAGLYAYEQTHSTVSVAIVMASVACAETAGAVIGGALADRFDRKLVASLAALGAAAMLAVLVVGADILWLTVVMTLATLCASPIRPAISAALPNLVVHDELDSANGYVQAWRNGAMTLGPVAVGVGAGLVGARGLFVVAAAALLLGVGVLAAIRVRSTRSVTRERRRSPIRRSRGSPSSGVTACSRSSSQPASCRC